MLLWKAFYPLSGGYNLNRVQWTVRDFDMFGTRMPSCCGAFLSFPVFYALLHSFVPWPQAKWPCSLPSRIIYAFSVVLGVSQ